MFQRCAISILSLLMVFPTPFWSNVSLAMVSVEADLELSEKLSASERLAGDLRDTINRSIFDIESLLSELDYDQEKIIRYVRDEIAFEQYRGVLRGPEGTLMGQAGNSLDQALLLAKLLKDAGYDARIAQGTLEEKDVRTLLEQMTLKRPSKRSMGDIDAAIAILKRSGMMVSLDASQTQKVHDAVARTPMIENMSEFGAFESTTSNLYEAFASFATGEASEWEQELLKEAREYFWVEAKISAAGSWQGIHPVLPPDVSVKPQKHSSMEETVPEELQHRIRLQIFIERSAGNKTSMAPVMTPWERPVANLLDSPVVFAVLPDSAGDPANNALPPTDVIDKASFFIPMLGNGPAPGAVYFDRAGNLIDPMAAGSAASGVFKEVGRSFGDAIGAIGDESAVPRLKAVWLDITLVAPGGEETQYRRLLTGETDGTEESETDAPLEYLLPLLRTNTLVVGAGRTPRAVAIDQILAQWQKSIPGIKALAWGLKNPGLTPPEQSSLSDVPGYWHGHAAMLSKFDLVEEWSDQHRIYRHEPLVAIHTAGVKANQEAMSRIDIVHNARRSFDISGNQPTFDPRGLIAAGVWETMTEGAMLRPGDRMGANQLLLAAQEQKIPLVHVKPGDPTTGLPIDEAGLKMLKEDLNRGYAVLIPKELPRGFEQSGWWRVNPTTGETLGLLDDGRGIEITSYQMTLIIGIAGLGFLHYSLYGCFSQAYGNTGSDVNFQLLCCVMFNYGSMLVMTVFAALIGLKLADLATDMVGLSVDVLDFGLGFDGMFCEAVLN